MNFAGTRNGKSVPTVYSGNGTENCVPFPLYTVGTLLPFLVPGILKFIDNVVCVVFALHSMMVQDTTQNFRNPDKRSSIIYTFEVREITVHGFESSTKLNRSYIIFFQISIFIKEYSKINNIRFGKNPRMDGTKENLLQ
jgi:hypothetical protein